MRAIETGDDASVLVARLNAVDAELKEMRGKRDEIVPPESRAARRPAGALPGDGRATWRRALSEEAVAGRAADELHELVDRIVVHWDEDARGHWLEIKGNLLEMLRKSAPGETRRRAADAIFAEVGCGGRI